jgi:hypothetical protein
MKWISREKIEKGPRCSARFLERELKAKRYENGAHSAVEHDDYSALP